MKLQLQKYLRFIYPALLGFSFIIFITIFLSQAKSFSKERENLNMQKANLSKNVLSSEQKYQKLLNEDQYKRNESLQKDIKAIESTYQKSLKTYEDLVDLRLQGKTETLDKQYALILSHLSQRNYASAEATLTTLTKDVQTEKDKRAAAQAAAQSAANPGTAGNIPASNAAPGSGFSRQRVSTDVGEFTVDIIAADLNSTRVIVDTASDDNCGDNCPVLSLGDYVGRSGAFAGINGTYFCPASYPQCAGKTNSFDLLVMNKNKKYLNSDNNVYSTNPAVIFSGSSARFVSQASQWGRDTGVDAVISNFPLTVSGGNVVFGGDGDPKKGSKGPRSFVGAKGSTAYIGIVYNATVAEGAHALKALGITDAMNLDSGGSTALWFGGYKAGPGRNIPNAVLFVRK